MRRLVILPIAILVISSYGQMSALAESAAGCGGDSGATLVGVHGSGSVSVSGSCSVRSTDLPGAGGVPVLIIDCGYATAKDDHTYWNKACGPTGFPCPAIAGDPTPHQFITTVALTDPPIPIAQWCAGVNTPMPSTAALRDEIIRLLSPPAIGISPDTGTGLVNLKTLYWVSTRTTVNLGRSALIGFPVELRVNYLRTDFDFGDGTSGTLEPTPGTPYDPAHDCGACNEVFGHTYAESGPVTVTAHTYWQAQYRIAGQPWTSIPGAVTANQPSTSTLTITQANSTLVSR